MAIRRLSISSHSQQQQQQQQLPRYYTPIPTKEKEDQSPLLSISTSTTPCHNFNSSSSSSSSSTSSSTTSPLSIPSLITPINSFSKSNQSINHFFDSLLLPISSSHFRFRRLWVLFFLTLSTTALILLILSLFHLDLPHPFSSFFESPPTRLLDLEDDFRLTTNHTLSTSSSHQIPFLLNRFGYTDESNLNQLPLSNDPIPSILHIVPPGKNVFSYLQWLSIKSAITKISPKQTMAHMIRGTIPDPGTNFWWDEMLRLPSVEIHETEDRTSIFGNPILDISHKTDVIRLEMLKKYGGIYLDTDILVLNSFDELLNGSEEIVMGVEKADGTLLHPTLVNGLCNAVIVAQRGAKFLDVWYDSYRTFEGQPFRGGGIWNYHSVILPWALAKNATSSQAHITVLDHHSFFMPLWDDPGLKQVHGTLTKTHPEPTPFKPNQFAYHMWHHLLDERISIATEDLLLSANDLGPEDALGRDSHFNFIAREYLSESVLDRYLNWKSKSKIDGL